MFLRHSGTFGDIYESPKRDMVKIYRFMDVRSGLAPDFIREISSLTILQNTDCVPKILEIDPTVPSITLPRYHSNLHDFRKSDKAFQWIIYRIAQCLYAAHNRGIIHRDVKPTNILANVENDIITELVLADWGSACLEGWCNVENPEMALQSLPFRAPEILLGTGISTTKMDIWSLGVMLLAYVMNKFIYFTSKNEMALLFDIFELIGTPVALQHIFPKFPRKQFNLEDTFIDLIFGMLEFDPEKRFDIVQVLNHPYFSLLRNDVVWKWDRPEPSRKRIRSEKQLDTFQQIENYFKQSRYNPRAVHLAYHYYQLYKTHSESDDDVMILNACSTLAEKVSEEMSYVKNQNVDSKLRDMEIKILDVLGYDLFQLHTIPLSNLTNKINMVPRTVLFLIQRNQVQRAKMTKFRWCDSNYVYTYVKHFQKEIIGWDYHRSLSCLPIYSIMRKPLVSNLNPSNSELLL